MPAIRFAIFAAVSTETQAEEMVSIPAQIQTCQRIINQHGVETAQYILDGYSRTGYDSLDVACQNIPPLSAAIAAAQTNQYDILIMDNFDRLGDLGYMIKTRFKKLKKQLFSARQSGKIIAPELYDPYADDSADISLFVGGIIQSYRINKIRRGYNIGIPARVERGLHPLGTLPYGYQRQRTDQPAIQIPQQAALILNMKDWLFAGLSLAEICRRANASGNLTHKGKQWDISNIRRVLENEYYAGMIAYNKTRAKKRLPRSRWQFAKGIHEPLWDDATYNAIRAELDLRARGRTHKEIFTLSGLLACAMCGKRLYRSGGSKHNKTYLSCLTTRAKHPMIEYSAALQLVAELIASSVHAEAAAPAISADALKTELEILNTARARVQEGFESQLYTVTEAHQKIIVIEKQMDEVSRKIQNIALNTANRKILLDLAKTTPAMIKEWILTGQPAAVNRSLIAIIERITITRDKQLTIKFR